MFKQSRFVFLTVTLLLVLFVSLARPMAVYADDSTPPPPTEEPTAPPTEEAPVEAESSPTEAPSEMLLTDGPTESPSGPAPTETPTEPSTEAESIVVSDILEAVPDGTEVVVLDENSEIVPLASEAAAQIVAAADPMWCPAGTLPGGAGCTINFASPQALIDNIDSSNPNSTNSIYEQHGIIYFTADPGGAFLLTRGTGNELQGADYDVLRVFNLTLQGGWNGLNDGSGFALSGQTNFGANRVQIGENGNPWGGNITINNIFINGTSDTGLMVFTDGDITLNAVDSQNNTGIGNGARLENDSGNGNVTVQNSSFNNNADQGLRVLSNGNITLIDVVTQNNATRGAALNNTTGSGNINISNTTFSGNANRGIDAFSNGNITLTNVIAQGNTETGVRLDNCRADGVTGICTGSGHISVDSSLLTDNGERGLVVDTAGNITLLGVIAVNNLGSGAQLHNDFTGSGIISVSSSTFSNNGVDGLEAYSNGDITVLNTTANGNAEMGASLINDTGEGNVTVSNSTFDSNTSTGEDVGLEIVSGGDVTLTNVSASNNLFGSGSYIFAGGLVIENSTFNNNSSPNPELGQGLFAEADEAEIICSQFSSNGTYGLDGTLVGLLTLDDVVFGGNGSGDYLGSPFVTTGGCSSDEGGEEGEGDEEGEGEGEEGEEVDGGEESPSSGSAAIIPLTGLSLHIVSVVDSEPVELDCEAFSGTKLVLPNGDSLILPCPIRDEGTLSAQAQDGLPGLLDEQFEFLSGMKTGVIRDGQSISLVDTGMIVEFVIPDGQNAENLAILHWDGSKWVEFPGNVTADGYFAVTTNFTGVFVLVTK
jgi:hypothetical protein